MWDHVVFRDAMGFLLRVPVDLDRQLASARGPARAAPKRSPGGVIHLGDHEHPTQRTHWLVADWAMGRLSRH